MLASLHHHVMGGAAVPKISSMSARSTSSNFLRLVAHQPFEAGRRQWVGRVVGSVQPVTGRAGGDTEWPVEQDSESHERHQRVRATRS